MKNTFLSGRTFCSNFWTRQMTVYFIVMWTNIWILWLPLQIWSLIRCLPWKTFKAVTIFLNPSLAERNIYNSVAATGTDPSPANSKTIHSRLWEVCWLTVEKKQKYCFKPPPLPPCQNVVIVVVIQSLLGWFKEEFFLTWRLQLSPMKRYGEFINNLTDL